MKKHKKKVSSHHSSLEQKAEHPPLHVVEELDPADTFPETENVAKSPSTTSETMDNQHYLNQNQSQTNQPSPQIGTPSAGGSGHDFQFSTHPQRSFPKWIIIAGLVLILGAGGLWIFSSNKDSDSQEPPSVEDILIETSPDNTDSQTEQEEVVEELDPADYQIQVLNGSGVAGAAGKMASVLKDANFEDVDAGNADDFDTQGVIIQVKQGEDALGDLIEKSLEDDYKDISVKDTLDEDSDFDAVITLGLQPGDKDILGAQDEIDQSSDKKSEATDSADTQ